MGKLSLDTSFAGYLRHHMDLHFGGRIGGSAKLHCSLNHPLPFVAASQSSPSCVAPNGHQLVMQQVNKKINFPLHH